MKGPSCETYQDDLAALSEGWLEGAAAERVRRHLDECPSCQADYKALQAAVAQLEAVGDAIRRRTPNVDLVAAVMETVTRDQSSVKKSTTFEEARERRSRRGLGWAAKLALAASLVLVAGMVIQFAWHEVQGPGGAQLASGHTEKTLGGAKPAEPERTQAPAPAPENSRLKAAIDSLGKSREKQHFTRPEDFQGTAPPDISKLTAKNILDIRKGAVSDEAGWGRLMQLATLSFDRARDLARSSSAAPDAVVGAAESLDAKEASDVLVTVIGHFAQNPGVHLALADAYAEQSEPAAQEEAKVEYQTVQQLDPQNALPLYMQAKVLLDQGNVQEALSALSAARALEGASTYGLENAQYQADALIAAGMDAQAAQMAVALTAGTGEYQSLCDLADSLLSQGQALWAAGDYDAAQEVFRAVQQLGQQVDASASLSQERLAALDIQRAAIEALSQAYTVLDTGDVDTLVQETYALADSFKELSDLLLYLDSVLFADVETDVWTMFSSLVLTEGDVAAISELAAVLNASTTIGAASSDTSNP